MSEYVEPRFVPHLGPWFEIEQPGNPPRAGVYLASSVGTSETGSLQLGYYYWDLSKWSDMGSSPEEALANRGMPILLFSVRNWQGLTARCE